MAKLNEQELRRVNMEKDMIQGNINRMCTAHTREELYCMYIFAVRRLTRILDCAEDAFVREEAREDED